MMICDDKNPKIKEIYDFLKDKLSLPHNVVGLTLHMYPEEPIQVHLQYIPNIMSKDDVKELKH
jgi:hypothetical protein